MGLREKIPKKIEISNTELKFIRPKPENAKAIVMEKEVGVFLDSVLAENTRKTYVRGLEIFEK